VETTSSKYPNSSFLPLSSIKCAGNKIFCYWVFENYFNPENEACINDMENSNSAENPCKL